MFYSTKIHARHLMQKVKRESLKMEKEKIERINWNLGKNTL